MPNHCFVPGCKSGYDSNSQEKTHLFKVTNNFLNDWSRRTHRKDIPLRVGSFICHLHFDERFLIKNFKHTINGEVVLIEREKWSLTKDAYPTIYPNLPKYLTKRLPKQRSSPSKRKAQTPLAKSERKKRRLPLLLEQYDDKPASSNDNSIDPIETNDELTLPPASTSSVSSRTSSSNPDYIQLKEKAYRLTHMVKSQRRTIRNLRNTIQTMRQSQHEELLKSLPPLQREVVLHFLKSARRQPQGMRYSKEWILNCLLLRIRSASAYDFLRTNKFLPLPDKSTLLKNISALDAKFGFDPSLFDFLKEKLKDMPLKERQGILLWDEIALKSHVEFQKSTGKFVGFSNVQLESETARKSKLEEGDHALVFMFRPFQNAWVQVIGSFCVKGATPGSILAKLILKAIIALQNCGAEVYGTVCDGSTTNKSALKALGIRGDKKNLQNTFNNPAVFERKVYVMIDIVHIIKCVRNNLLKQQIFKV